MFPKWLSVEQSCKARSNARVKLLLELCKIDSRGFLEGIFERAIKNFATRLDILHSLPPISVGKNILEHALSIEIADGWISIIFSR